MCFFLHFCFGPVFLEVFSPHRYHHLLRVLRYVHEIPLWSSPFTALVSASFSIISTMPLVHLCSFCALLFKPSQPCLSLSSKLLISSCLSDVHSFPILSSLITSNKILRNFSSATSRWASHISVRATSPNLTSKTRLTKL